MVETMTPAHHHGVLIIRIFVANWNDPHQGRAKVLARIPCMYGEADERYSARKEANGD
jgi:hypothetical protein